MLCLSRKIGEKIVIGENVVVQVLRVKDGRVRLGVTCPDGVPIDREEVYERKANARRQAESAK